MKRMIGIHPSFKAYLLLLAILGMAALDNRSVVSAQFLEDFGHIGTLKMFKGQVRDGLDSPIPHATLKIINLKEDADDYAIEADESGNFIKTDLPSGKYRINVLASGFNIGEFTVRISQDSLFASEKYIIVKLSPGCSSGDSGVKLVSKIKKR